MGFNLDLATPIENVVSTIQKNSPSLSCVVDELVVNARFNSFTCKNRDVVDNEKACAYLACVTSLLVMKAMDINSVSQCSNLDFDVLGNMFADCEWCTEDYGCFQVGGPFISLCHPISLPPQPLPCLDLKLQLYTRLNPTSPQLLNTNLSNINQTNFKAGLKTMFLVGGWQEGDFKPYDSLLINSSLHVENMNVVIFNWNKGSGTEYGQSVANTRLLGRMLAYIIRDLHVKTNYPLANVHLVGHSLGAQLVGYAGKDIQTLGQDYKIGRITGLDPAGPFYNCEEGPVRLDSTDATFVDVIHTNAGVFGDVVSNGYIDFWPNGGALQPGCTIISRLNNSETEDKVFCEHTKSVHYFASSMDNGLNSGNCEFRAHLCAKYEDFESGVCDVSNCDGCKCARMGYFASEYFAKNCPAITSGEAFYLKTREDAQMPYCVDNVSK